ncbi:N-acetyltransferase [Streptomyces sp. NBC_01481]|uniref:GNAT family N-acetyltransferase n=1 Tax=Streptomyces sp. NBC_01481 TaxID=2975869 RepID=UPI0022535A45|nr:GNAT family N-acetyltransferase [Streptomyces sp. NBC_01481]MCX4585843.1 GNAT family N-acetyltransferase [Streptomyces sp. NBC_01481]
MILEELAVARGEHGAPDISGELLTEIAELYASNQEFFALSGDFADPYDIRIEQVAKALADELAHEGAQVLLARSRGELVGLAVTLDHHPTDPDDQDPWIGLLMIDRRRQRSGFGRRLAGLVEDRFRRAGRTGSRLAVLENNPKALSFWTSLGYTELRRANDRELNRPSIVLRKPL